MKKGSVVSTDLVCLECGNVFSIMRKVGHQKSISHIKNLWCFKCKKVTEHYEVKKIDRFMIRDTSNEVELFVKELVTYGKTENQERTNRIFKKILKK